MGFLPDLAKAGIAVRRQRGWARVIQRQRRWIWGALVAVGLAGCSPTPPNDVSVPPPESTVAAISEGAPEVLVVSEDLPPPPLQETRSRRTGFLGIFRGTPEATETPAPTEAPETETSVDGPDETTEETAAPTEAETADAAQPPRARGRLLGFLSQGGAARTTPTAAPPGIPTFGPLVKACGVRKRDMGREVARSAGGGTYRLFDTKPNSVAPRVHYLTGFRDECPRRIYGALVFFGSPLVHETKRYDRSIKRGYSEADLAYEKVKGQVCNVGRAKPCPSRHQARLAKQVTLLTVYENFGSTREWLDVVLYKGRIAGQAIER